MKSFDEMREESVARMPEEMQAIMRKPEAELTEEDRAKCREYAKKILGEIPADINRLRIKYNIPRIH